jgi:hypothetical protein
MKYSVLFVHAASGHVVAMSFVTFIAFSVWETSLTEAGYDRIFLRSVSCPY